MTPVDLSSYTTPVVPGSFVSNSFLTFCTGFLFCLFLELDFPCSTVSMKFIIVHRYAVVWFSGRTDSWLSRTFGTSRWDVETGQVCYGTSAGTLGM